MQFRSISRIVKLRRSSVDYLIYKDSFFKNLKNNFNINGFYINENTDFKYSINELKIINNEKNIYKNEFDSFFIYNNNIKLLDDPFNFFTRFGFIRRLKLIILP